MRNDRCYSNQSSAASEIPNQYDDDDERTCTARILEGRGLESGYQQQKGAGGVTPEKFGKAYMDLVHYITSVAQKSLI